MNDFERFEELINNGAGCISIVTYEEGYALDIAYNCLKNKFIIFLIYVEIFVIR